MIDKYLADTTETNPRRLVLGAAAIGIMQAIGEDPTRPGLADTPRRYADAWQWWGRGYTQDPFAGLTVFEEQSVDDFIFQGPVPWWSMCEHHLAPFFGTAFVGYIPRSGRIIGLSKIARVVSVFSRRLQVQERLTEQVARTLDTALSPIGIGVVMRARHGCMESRGVERGPIVTTTSCLLGVVRDKPSVRSEFFKLLDISDKAF